MSLTGSAPVKLTLSSNFLRNTSFDNDDLDIHYRVETNASIFNPSPLTKLYRWDTKAEKEVLIAEWKKSCWSSDKYRIVAHASLGDPASHLGPSVLRHVVRVLSLRFYFFDSFSLIINDQL